MVQQFLFGNRSTAGSVVNRSTAGSVVNCSTAGSVISHNSCIVMKYVKLLFKKIPVG